MRKTLWLALLLLAAPAGAAPDGKALYQQNCAGCHGVKGLGDGPTAAVLDSKPTNLAAGNYKLGESDKSVLKVITEGVRGTQMEGFGSKLSEPERQAIVAYLKQLRGGK